MHNFNPLATMCGRVRIAEVEELVQTGDLDPTRSTRLVFLQRVVALTPEQAADMRIERGLGACATRNTAAGRDLRYPYIASCRSVWWPGEPSKSAGRPGPA
jgi:hypothetical protein